MHIYDVSVFVSVYLYLYNQWSCILLIFFGNVMMKVRRMNVYALLKSSMELEISSLLFQ